MMNNNNIVGVMAILALGLLVFAILIVACGPAAQTAQESSATTGAPLQAPTDTPALAGTPTPTIDWQSLPTLPPTIEFTERPGMDVLLTAASIEYEKRQAEGGATGQVEPELIQVRIFVLGSQEREAIIAFLDRQGIVHSISEYRDSVLYATIPASLLTTLAAHPSFGAMERVISRYPNLERGLDLIIAWYEAGMMPEEDSNPTYAELSIGIEGDANYNNIRRFLKNNGAVMGYEDVDNDLRWKPLGVLIAYVPITQVLPLSEQPGFQGASVLNHPVPEWMRFTREPILPIPETPAPTATPALRGSSGPGGGVSGARRAKPVEENDRI